MDQQPWGNNRFCDVLMSKFFLDETENLIGPLTTAPGFISDTEDGKHPCPFCQRPIS